jgi:large subunit ribosomal protein L4
MPLPVLNAEGVTVGEAALAGALVDQEVKPHLIHETVVAELAARRRGTHATRNRAQVRGGGRKPWRQKGTGRARHGSIRAPQWAGGGVTFGPVPRSHEKKVNRKARQQAFHSALRAHVDRGSMAVMEATGWDEPSTKRAAAYMYQAPEALAARPLLVIVEDAAGVDACSFRNLAGVHVLAVDEVETVDIMAGRALLVAAAAWERLAGELGDVTPVTPKAKPKPKPKPKPRASTRRKAAAEAEPEAEAQAEAAQEPGPEPEAQAEPRAEAEPEAPEGAPEADAGEEPEADAGEEPEPEAGEEPQPEADGDEAEGEEESR